MKRKCNILVFSILVMIMIMSCKKVETYPDIPEVHFKSYTAEDSVDVLGNEIKLVELVFTFVDGDGDIGLKQSDTIPPYVGKYKNNFFSTLYVKDNGKYKEVENIAVSNYTIPYIEPQGQNKTLKADVKVKFEYTISQENDSLFNYDTMMYKFYIVDRALHQSNIDSTSDIVFKK